MATRTVGKVTKQKKVDREHKGTNRCKKKRTSIGKSRNSRPNNKNAVREKKGR